MTGAHPWTEQVAPYALGALPEDERRDFEAHLATCPECRREVDAARAVTRTLALAPPPVRAPRELRDRIMATVEAEAELLRAAGPAADRPPARRRGLRLGPLSLRPLSAGLAAGGLAVALVAGWTAAGLLNDDSPGRRVIAAQVTGAPGARGSIELAGERATLRVRRMPGPGRGRVYQVWLQDAKGAALQPTHTLFSVGRGGDAAVGLPAGARGSYRIYVSSEPPGGSPTGMPSRPPVLAASL